MLCTHRVRLAFVTAVALALNAASPYTAMQRKVRGPCHARDRRLEAEATLLEEEEADIASGAVRVEQFRWMT